MSKRFAITAFAVVFALALSASAFGAKGGGGKGGGGKGGGGKVDPVFAISSQQVGAVTFSVMVPSSSSGLPSLVVTTKCFDSASQLNYSASLPVAWGSAAVGYAGPFSAPSGEGCFAYVHTPTSDRPLVGGTFSFVAT